MKLIFIRHGDPDYVHDTVTARGVREAQALNKRVAQWNVDKFYCSPLGRARDTAALALEGSGNDVTVEQFLREFYVQKSHTLGLVAVVPDDGCRAVRQGRMAGRAAVPHGRRRGATRTRCFGDRRNTCRIRLQARRRVVSHRQGQRQNVGFLLSLGRAVRHTVAPFGRVRARALARLFRRADVGDDGGDRGARGGNGCVPL